jgi:hypothetical protein
MAMNSVTNRAPGPRVLNVKDGDLVAQRVLQPGETADLELVDQKEKGLKAQIDAGQILVGPAGQKPETEAERNARVSAETDAVHAEALKAEYDRGFAEGVKSVKKA